MASTAQINYLKSLLSKVMGASVEDYSIDNDTPVKAASWLIDKLKSGYKVTVEEWKAELRNHIRNASPVPSELVKPDSGMYDKSIFEYLLRGVTDPTLRKFSEALIEKVPDYFYRVPASTGGKNHPQFAQGTGGLVRHTMGCLKVAEELLDNPLFTSELPELGDQMLRVALAFHDSFKQGLNFDGYAFEHPLWPRRVYEKELKGTLGFTPEQEEIVDQVLSAIDSHMGPWNKDSWGRSHVTLPIPETPLEKLTHLADYIASRKFITLPEV